MSRTTWVLLASMCSTLLAAPAFAYPDRPVEVIVPSNAGGGTDLVFRPLAQAAEPLLKQKIVVDNRPGGGGTLGVALLTRAKPDGYTLGAVWPGPLTASPHTMKLPYTPADYTPVIRFATAPNVLCVAPDFPANTAQELFDNIRANPGKYTYGNDGLGGTNHLAFERIWKRLNLKVRAVVFDGGGDTAKNFLGGHINFYSGALPAILPHARIGKAKCLLVTSAKRTPALPEVQALDEVGLQGEETLNARMIIVPKGTPPDIVTALYKVFAEAVMTDEYKKILEKLGETPATDDGATMRKIIDDEYQALGRIATDIGIAKH